MRLAIATVLFCVCGAFTGTALAENKWVHIKGGSWEPSATVLADIKKRLEPYVSNQAKLQARRLRKWREYLFQYQGGEEKGRKYVFINALCRPDAGWKLEEDFYIVRDGGSCYFHLKYDPTRRRFAELTINGEA